jgi:hypothetical protein
VPQQQELLHGVELLAQQLKMVLRARSLELVQMLL